MSNGSSDQKPTLTDNGDGTWTFKQFDVEVVFTGDEVRSLLEPISDLSSDELEKLAKAASNGRVFTSFHIREPRDIPMVFMPLALMGQKQRVRLAIHDINCIYEYIDKAGPRSINGMPIFFSMQMLSRTDGDKLLQMLIDEQ